MKRALLLLTALMLAVVSVDAQAPKGSTDLWDFVTSFRTSTGRQYGVATNGEYIFTCAWGSSSTVTEQFYKYDIEGTLLESFSIPGCPWLRDMTYDGQYFYAGSADSETSGELYCFDLVNKTMVGSISTPCAGIRHCSYDAQNDGFWIGTSTTLMLVNRSGVVQTTVALNLPSNTFCDGTGYFVDPEGVAHLFMMCNVGVYPFIFDYNITNNAFNTTSILEFANTPGYVAYGGAGGAFVGEYQGRTYFFGDSQASPNFIGIYDLGEGDAPGPNPPDPVEGDLFYDFENGTMMSWTPIDADGDGYNWQMRSYGVPGSQFCVTSSSNFGGTVLFPDNYLVSPIKDRYNQVVFKVCPQDSQYNAEHVGVAISTTSNTDPNAFETVWETTLTGPASTWEEVYLDLSAYSGQEFWVAFRHFNCNDQFWLNIDDVALFIDETSLTESNTPSLNVYPNPVTERVMVQSEQVVDRYDVFSVTGALLYSNEVGSKAFEVNVSQLPAGVYFIRMNSAGVVQTKRFLKQ